VKGFREELKGYELRPSGRERMRIQVARVPRLIQKRKEEQRSETQTIVRDTRLEQICAHPNFFVPGEW
jgi:hypothetical protein